MPLAVLVPFLLFGALSLVFGLRAWAHVRADSPEAWARGVWEVFVRGPAASASTYTERGLRFRRISYVFAGLALLSLFAWPVLQAARR